MSFKISGVALEDTYLCKRDLQLLVTATAWNVGGWWRYQGLGIGSNTSSPVQLYTSTNWKQVEGSAGVRTDGTLWCWGENVYGALGVNSTNGYYSPVQTISGGTNWSSVSNNYRYTAGIKTDGTLWLWGHNGYGQLGDGTYADKSSPVQTIAGGTNWKQIATASEGVMMAAVKTDGTLWLWGTNNYGQLGDNTVDTKNSPIQTIAGGTSWKQASVGTYHIAAIKTDGTLWLWGDNNYGQLGDNTVTGKSSPVQTISIGTNWKQVSCGNSYSSAIKTDGTLWLWGSNNQGQLGDNSTTRKSSPVQTVAGGTNWKSVSASAGRTTGSIKTDGTLWLWGDNTYGKLGDNSTTAKSSPVQTVAAGTSWKYVSVNSYNTYAVKIGDVVLW